MFPAANEMIRILMPRYLEQSLKLNIDSCKFTSETKLNCIILADRLTDAHESHFPEQSIMGIRALFRYKTQIIICLTFYCSVSKYLQFLYKETEKMILGGK